MNPEDLLDKVVDRETFVAFVIALADEREQAATLESANPDAYMIDGALNWKNGDIHSFLGAMLAYYSPKPFHHPEKEPSWKMMAELLYFGKIYE